MAENLKILFFKLSQGQNTYYIRFFFQLSLPINLKVAIYEK